MEKVLAFDLSSKCIGVVAAAIEDNKVEKIQSTSIVPPRFSPSSLGFMNAKKKITTASGKQMSCYVYKNETSVTFQEKRKRDKQVREAKNAFVINDISQKIDALITNFKPDKILVEKNEIFNGILTSILLARINGVLFGIANLHNINVVEFHVQEVRKPYNVMKLTSDFVKGKTSEELKDIPDITKRAIRKLMETKYNHEFLTDDESDACIVLDYYINYASGSSNVG